MKKVLFITGGNRGLGLALINLFASKGYDIVVTTRKSYKDFEVHCKSLEQQYGILIHILYMDLENRQAISLGLKEFSALKIVPTVLINNASIFFDKTVLMSTVDDIERCFQVNYFAAVQITQRVAKLMLRKGGTIINISSVSSFTKQELAPFNIRVNAVAPGGMDTDMFTELNKKNKEVLIANTALKRIGNVSEIAEVVYFLATEKSSYINGQVIRVDGGLIY